ncbi:L-asparaginase/GlutRNAGln amidotransferase subunit D [Saprospira grandis DSM 2844]|uniref:L-asparaginase/GlutRNAGln amidotransferase subunit D n=1 Tax=Saprospira grandis DSM 2844 TaxID=694433 RepID=J0XXW1_9BACT|nr:asparaginase domain-containing protein [Saprospira grandis]EJF53941.1 L-asparaginase/GlutRNAGln amidotransferase subunit D [Saprospira grandis DSM 2844]
MKKNKSILALVTGGTFDKEYDMITGKLFFKDTHLPEIFKRGRATLDIKVRTLMMVDSLEMTDLDRDIIIKHCQSTEEQQILITHGTDTMEITAAAIAKAGKIGGKTIVLLGAMIPYTFGMSSDGFFNLGSAIAFVQTLPPGVYIAMHGEYFNWDNVRKNRSTGYFEAPKDKKH